MQPARDTTRDSSVPAGPRRALLLANERSGSFTKEGGNLQEVVNSLHEQGWDVDLQFSTSPDDARQRTREAVQQNMEMVIAVGGDGTINTVIQELAGSETALGLIPSGTFNAWAREAGIPLDMAGARDILLNGRIRHIDLGRADDRYYLLMAGIGFGV